MVAAAAQELVGVRRCSIRQPGAAEDAEWLELTVRSGSVVAVYRVPGEMPSLTWDAPSHTIRVDGLPLANWAGEEQVRRSATPGQVPIKAEEAPPGVAMLLAPHIPAHNLAVDALLFGAAAAVGAGGAAAVEFLAQAGEDAKILPPQPKNKPRKL